MQLTLDTNNSQYIIRSYEPGKVLLADGTLITNNFIISPDQLINPWPVKTLQTLNTADLTQIFDLNPEVVLLGSGEQLHFPDQAIITAFYNKHIGIEVMNTGAACRTYDVLMAEGRRVVAALFLAD